MLHGFDCESAATKAAIATRPYFRVGRAALGIGGDTTLLKFKGHG